MQPDPAELLSRQARDVLTRFGVSDGDLIGYGMESLVYRLDNARVLRVPRGTEPSGNDLEAIRLLLADIAPHLPFAVPEIREVADDNAYVIETWLPGRAMSELLETARDDDRRTMWRNYMAIPQAFAAITMEAPYGRILTAEPFTSPTWRGYIQSEMKRAGDENRNHIEADVGNAEAVLAAALALTEAAPETPPPALVHGDIYPSNVLMDEAFNVSAVIDFGWWTLAGDPVFDLAMTYISPFMTGLCDDEDARTLRARVPETHERAFACYRALAALVLADPANRAEPYPTLYDWCIATLRDLADGRLKGL